MIRAATPDQINDLVALEQLCFTDEAWSSKSITAEFSLGFIFVLISNDAVYGYTVGRIIADECHLLRIAVAPDHRGMGHGFKLLNTVHEHARKIGATRVLLEVRADNVAACSLYLRHGYQSDGTRLSYYPDGTDASLFSLALKR